MNPGQPSPDRLDARVERSAGSSRKGRVRVFVIFDTEHDGDLYALLHEQANRPGWQFSVIGGSAGSSNTEIGRERVRSRIRAADQVIIICGEHADSSPRIHSEFLMAQGEQKPYFLLWGRRGVMCSKPIGAKPAEGMYSWTQQFLHDQIAFNLRKCATHAEAKSFRREPRSAGTPPRTVTTRHEAIRDPATAPTLQ